MKLSVNWLKQFVVDLDNDEAKLIVEKLSSSLTEVEDFYDVASALDKIFAVEVTEITDHPENDKLKIAVVKESEDKIHEVIYGADNVKVGNIVPLCLPGGTVYNSKSREPEPVKIEAKEMGGVKSFGMLCSQKELGIGDDHSGIYILPNSTPIGTNVAEILRDTIIEVENKGITNRPDCFSHVGIAREIAVQNKFKFVETVVPQKPIQTASKDLTVKIQDTESTKRYLALVITDIKVAESPLWMQARLITNGIRPVNNIVDITNYLMLEIGQPSHAFDYDRISQNTLILRRAEQGEQIKTLDGKNRVLDDTMLVNCDGDKPIGVAGVMGGENSEITNSTTTIVLQVENFEMYNIRSTSRKLGLRTDASTRFEKGLDPNLAEECMYRLAEMVVDIAGGEIASELIDVFPNPEEPVVLEFNVNLVRDILGLEMDRKNIIDILKSLGIEIDPKTEKSDILKLTIPSFRRDLRLKEDILEEIVRIWGFDKVPFTLPTRNLNTPVKNQRFEIEKRVKNLLSATGSHEVLTYAFIGAELYEKARLEVKDNLRLKNPLSPELEFMRDTVLPSLLDKTYINSQRFETIDLFEVSKTVLKKTDESGMHIQPKFISGIYNSENLKSFHIVKGKVEELFRELGISDVRFVSLDGQEPFKKSRIFHPKKSALIFSGEQQIGIMGYIHPRVEMNFELENELIGYELNFDLVSKLSKEFSNYKVVSNKPTVNRALSFWIGERIEISKISNELNNISDENLVEWNITDIYRDIKDKDKKSISIEFILQSHDKTLTEDEINTSVNNFIDVIQNKIKGEIRNG